MILGIGTDICDVGRIAGVLERRGDRFTRRVFTDAERTAGDARPEAAAFYARRFAAKEACAKALGTGFTKGIRWHDIEIRNMTKGKPLLHLTGGALARLKRLTPRDHEIALHLSLADDPPIALAFVVLEARPRQATLSSA